MNARLPGPDILYKYRCWDDTNHKKILTHNEIFFASPRSFNDPFDCRIPLPLLDAPKKEMLKACEQQLKKDHPNLNREQRKKQAKTDVDEFRRRCKDPAFRKEREDENLQEVFNDFGVLSLSDSDENILLWSHYAASHKGFCVGLDVEKLCATANKNLRPTIPSNLFPVEYAEDYPVLDPFSKVGGGKIEALNLSLTIKSRDWSYEKEWRLIIMGDTDKVLVLPNEAIYTVILGSEMDESSKEQIKAELRKKPNSVKLTQAVLGRKKFGLDFEDVAY